MKGKAHRNVLMLISFLVVLELNFVINIQAQQNIQYITVDKNGGGDYTKIQDAINNAPELSTIFIKAGTYSEIIDIKKNINLIGEDKYKVLINPISEKNKYAMRIGAPNVKISKLGITNGAPGPYTSGLYISASYTELEDCNIYDTPIGIAVWTPNNTINNCYIWGCKDEGIALLGSTSSECNNNKITNCILHNNCDGIELQYSSNNIIANCEIRDNTHMGIDAITSSNNKNTISNCTIFNNKVNGIYLASSSDNKILDCLISNNKDGNIATTGSSYNNKVKESVSEVSNPENNILKQETKETSSAQYESNKQDPGEDNILIRIFNVVSSLMGLFVFPSF